MVQHTTTTWEEKQEGHKVETRLSYMGIHSHKYKTEQKRRKMVTWKAGREGELEAGLLQDITGFFYLFLFIYYQELKLESQNC